MDFSDTLKLTLVNTYNLAEALESVSNTICPRRTSQQHRKRIMLINREIRNFSQLIRSSAQTPKKQRNPLMDQKLISTNQPQIINDSPGYLIKKKLSSSIKEINERVKMSRAGKRTIGSFISKEAGSPSIVKKMNSLSSTWQEGIKNYRFLNIDEIDEKPQPYVPLTNAKIEDPIFLPTFNEFLQAKGAEFVIRKGSEEMFYRIDKAMERIAKLGGVLDSKLATMNNLAEEKKSRKFRGRVFNFSQKSDGNEVEIKKNQELRKILNQYYKMPAVYVKDKCRFSSAGQSPLYGSLGLSSEAEENLEESLRDFYRSKAMENKKLGDILEKISKDRPLSIREKVLLIQEDREKYKNKNHSIEKFNDFRGKVELKKRSRQFKNFSQGVAYFEVLDEFKRKKHEPSDPELLLLELWRRIIESGWVIGKAEFEEMISILTLEELQMKSVQGLIEKLSMSCYN